MLRYGCARCHAPSVFVEKRVDQGDVAREALVGQVRIVAGELRALEEALVHDALAVERADVKPAGAVDVGHRVLDLAARGVQRAIEAEDLRVGVVGARLLAGEPLCEAGALDGRDEQLGDLRFGVERGRAQIRVVRRDRAPLQDLQSVHGEHLRDNVVDLGLHARFGRHEHGADGVHLGQIGVDDLAEEVVGARDHDAGAVARVLLGARRTAVFEVLEQFDGVGHRSVARIAVEINDSADPAVRTLVRYCRKPPPWPEIRSDTSRVLLRGSVMPHTLDRSLKGMTLIG